MDTPFCGAMTEVVGFSLCIFVVRTVPISKLVDHGKGKHINKFTSLQQ